MLLELSHKKRLWGVKITETDEQFYEGMKKVPQVGYCKTFVDRKWAIQHARKEYRKKILLVESEKSKVRLYLVM